MSRRRPEAARSASLPRGFPGGASAWAALPSARTASCLLGTRTESRKPKLKPAFLEVRRAQPGEHSLQKVLSLRSAWRQLGPASPSFSVSVDRASHHSKDTWPAGVPPRRCLALTPGSLVGRHLLRQRVPLWQSPVAPGPMSPGAAAAQPHFDSPHLSPRGILRNLNIRDVQSSNIKLVFKKQTHEILLASSSGASGRLSRLSV